MKPATLIRMANDIGAFFAAEAPGEAARSVCSHMKRFWDPRMRAQIFELYRGGADGFSDHVRAAVAMLEDESGPR